ncbi:MAG: HlyD family efflux transporter periplasmic adaptor subunit [Verrucomicrobia bacterium]|nr:HlyD family efflux transporter periplasmic adaptor subunit [Verrucomicrobiota bacterium]
MTTRNRQRRKSGLSWTVLILVAVAGAFAIRAYIQKSGKPQYPPNAFYEVKRGDLLISVVEDGALRAVNETIIRNNLEGVSRIIHLVPEGSHVKKGDLLVELDSSVLRDRLNEQELAYQDNLFLLLQARENLKIQKSLVESRIKDAELQVELAKSDLEKYRDGDAPQQIRISESRIGVLEEQVRIASARFTRTEQLFKEGTATKSELEADSLSLKREQLGLEQIREDLRLLKKFDQPNMIRMLESKLQLAKDELERLKQRSSNELAQAEADLKTSQRAQEITDETLKQQRRQLENAKIYAPQDGLVAYSTSSPFQGRGEGGFEEGRSRGSRGGRGMADFGGGFQSFGGEGRRGQRGSGGGSGWGSSSSGGGYSSSSSSGSSGRSGGSSSVGSGTTSSGSSSQASTSGTAGGSGSSASRSQSASMGGGMQGSSAGGGFGGASGGGRSGGGSGGGGFSSGGGGGSGGASPSFASYGSIRQSSQTGSSGSMGQSSGAGSGFSGSGGSGSSFGGSGSGSSFGSSSSSAYGVQNPYSTTGSQSSSRFGSQSSSFDMGSFMFIGTSGVIEEGAMVRQRQELIRLPDVSKMLAEVKIHESRVRQVHPGMPAYVRVETLPGRRFKGTVRRVAILPDTQASWVSPDTKVYATDVLIDEELPELKPGVSARAQIIITNLTQVLSVPIQAVTTFNGEHVCYVKKGSGVSPISVKTGWFNDQLIEVSSGLKEGDLVLLAPTTDEEHLDPEAQTPQSSTASEAGSARNNAAAPPGDSQPAAENRSIENGQRPAGPPRSTPSQTETGVQRGENQPAEGTEGGARSGGRGRRGQGPLDPEMQKRMEEFMKLSPEEREERMRQFRGRRGQGQGQGQPQPDF